MPPDNAPDKELLAKLHSEVLKEAKPSIPEGELEKLAVEVVRKGRKGRFAELRDAGLVK